MTSEHVMLPIEPTEDLYKAYRHAVGNTIKAAITDGSAEQRWQHRAVGYKLSEREKFNVRYRAMIEIAKATQA